MKEIWEKEMRKVYLLQDNSIYIEEPSLDEYYSRLEFLGLFDKGKSKSNDKNSIGACWFRSYAGDRDISKYEKV